MDGEVGYGSEKGHVRLKEALLLLLLLLLLLYQNGSAAVNLHGQFPPEQVRIRIGWRSRRRQRRRVGWHGARTGRRRSTDSDPREQQNPLMLAG